MNPMYDVVILGCGEAGIFAAYELARLHPDLKITALDQGRDIYHRSCPIVAGKVKECIHCPVCDTMCGFGGAGAFSDGKFNFTTQFGGWLTDFMDAREVMELIDYVDSINVAHGATTECFSTSTPEARALERRALAYDLHLLQARCKHLGTENNLRILQNIYEGLKDKLEFRFNTPVTHIAREGEDFRLTLGKDLDSLSAPLTFTVEFQGRTNTITAQPGRIRVESADCPDQVCVDQGWISDGTVPVVCLPNRLVIQIEGGGDGLDSATG